MRAMTGYDLIKAIEKTHGKARLTGWQFAADGRWDTAEIVLLNDVSAATPGQLQSWLRRQATDNIAFEALFEFANGEWFFFGVRISHLGAAVKLKIFGALVAGGRDTDCLGDTIERIRDILGDRHIAADLPEYLELGVFALWNRVKSLVVWKAGARLIMPEEMPGLTKTPDDGYAPLHETQPQPLMLEAAWKRDTRRQQEFQCWISLPVSGPGEKHMLVREKYLAAAAIFIGDVD